MKKVILSILAVSLLFTSCQKEQLAADQSYNGTVTVVKATFEKLAKDGATKAAVTDAGVFTWQSGDSAAFAESDGSSSYCSGANSIDGATASFAIVGEYSFTSDSWAIYPYDLTKGQSPAALKVNVPASREWANGQTNVTMYGVNEASSSKFNFSHMGGLVRVRVKNVPTNAREFVFKASGCKINGEFNVEEESDFRVIKTSSTSTEAEQTYTLTWTTSPAENNTMDFYIPLPVGTYSNGFAFYLYDAEHNILHSTVGSTSQSIGRKKLLLMPAITLAGGEMEPIEKAAFVQEIPAGYSGDFPLAICENVLLKINASDANNDITLKYSGGNLPANLEIQVIGDKKFDKKISGTLPYTHVDYTEGDIAKVEITTSSSTFNIVYPATISEKLTVNGGNVVLKGATVQAVEVAENAVADETTKAPVQIVMEKYTSAGSVEQIPAVPNNIKANADVVVTPAENVEVKVEAENDAKVANGGKGIVKDSENNPITIKAVAKIGDIKYISLADAIAAAQNGNTIQMITDFETTDKIFVGEDKNIVLDLNGKKISYTTDGYESFIENRGQLTVMDSDQNGIITAKFNHPNWNAGCYTINNAGTYDKASKLVIESGTIENTSPAGLAWPISNGIYGTNADLVINGGTIHSTNYVPVREYLQCGGKKTIVINGGKFISDNSRAIAIQVNDATIQDTGSSVTINGGEFTCNGSGILYVDMHAANANLSGFTMTINEGTFENKNAEAPVLAYDYEGKDHQSAVLLSKILKGGTYSKEPASDLLADGYAVKQNTDGDWTVEIENFWPNFAASSFSNINEDAKTITISSPAELALLAKKINGGTSYAGYTISINGSLDMGAHFWIPINAYNKGSLSGATIKGVNSATIANLKIEKAIYKGNYDYYAGFIAQAAGGVTFKDLTFSGAVSVDNGSGVATVLGQTYGNVLFDNVKVVNSTVSAETKAGSLLGFTGGDGIKVTVKDCSLDNVTVKAEYSYALMVGLVNTNDQVVFEGNNTVTNSHAELDETIAANDFPTRKTIKEYTYGVDDNKLWVIGVQDAWAECRSNPTPKITIDNVEYSVMGDIFYHEGSVVVNVCVEE